MGKLSEIINSFKETAENFNFEIKQAGGLISPYFKGEFNLSAGHQYVLPILTSSKEEILNRIAITERCFRRMDLGRIGYSKYHLLLFEMGVVGLLGHMNQYSLRDALSYILDFSLEWLCNKLGLKKARFLFTVCKEADAFGQYFPEDKISIEALRMKDISDEQVISIRGRRNFLYSEGINRPAGYSIEIFYHLNGDFIEIASINIYSHIIKNGKLSPTVNIACGNGFGFERILCVLNSNKSIFETEIFTPIIDFLKAFFPGEKEYLLSKEKIYLVAELMRSISFIFAEGQTLDKSGRGKILKRMINQLFSEINFLSLPIDQVISQTISILSKAYGDRYNFLAQKEELIKKNILTFTKINDEQE
jgi:alanyl-tRNA synthetase